MADFLYNKIVNDIERKIMINKLKVSDKLPSERELAISYDVSRNVVREAIMVLRVNGFVEIKPGKGIYVTKPNEENVTNSLQRVLKSNRVTGEDILDVREELEIIIIKKAIKKATNKSIKELKEIYKQMDQRKHLVADFIEKDAEFHLMLAQSTQNDVYYFLIHSFFDLTERGLLNITIYSPESVTEAQTHHKRIIEAIETRDESLAISTIKEHLDLLRDEVETLKAQEIINEETGK